MAWQLRLQYEGVFYHVTARGNELRKIYFSEYDYQKFRGNNEQISNSERSQNPN